VTVLAALSTGGALAALGPVARGPVPAREPARGAA
jgi:hypothetical protein